MALVVVVTGEKKARLDRRNYAVCHSVLHMGERWNARLVRSFYSVSLAGQVHACVHGRV